MISDAERWLNAQGWPIEEEDFGREDEPLVAGCALLREVGDGVMVRLVVRPGLEGELRVTFAEWAQQKILRFAEHGPEPDGWQRRSDGDWQLWARLVQLPSLD